jgi:hypothetical protein
MMDAWNIADALVAGRWLPRAKVQRVLMANDQADALYAGLFHLIVEAKISSNVAEAVAVAAPHPPTAKAWAYILVYAATPSRANYEKIARAARDDSNTAGAVIRLAPLVLASSHRRRFRTVVEQVAQHCPAFAADLEEVCRDLNQPGPGRLYARRRVAAAKSLANGS